MFLETKWCMYKNSKKKNSKNLFSCIFIAKHNQACGKDSQFAGIQVLHPQVWEKYEYYSQFFSFLFFFFLLSKHSQAWLYWAYLPMTKGRQGLLLMGFPFSVKQCAVCSSHCFSILGSSGRWMGLTWFPEPWCFMGWGRWSVLLFHY